MIVYDTVIRKLNRTIPNLTPKKSTTIPPTNVRNILGKENAV